VSAKPRVSVGVPVFRGERWVSDALQSLRAQTFPDFNAVVSVDGRDEASAAICRHFESDPRFRVAVQPARLGFAGNFNWLVEWLDTEFFIYLSQDDRLDAQCLATLVADADDHPDALIVYPAVQWFDAKQSFDVEPEIHGTAFARVIAQLAQGHWRAIHGLMRAKTAQLAGPLVADSPDSIFEDVVWFTKVMRLGTARCVPDAVYLKRLHAEAVSSKQAGWPQSRARRAWLRAWTQLVAAALPAAASDDDVRRIIDTAVKRLAVDAPDMAWFFNPARLGQDQRRELVVDFVEHLRQNAAVNRILPLEIDWSGIRRGSPAADRI
jgi:glycosyltransferase involved in cell wall biosynthesis